ncbi:transmembrane protein 141 isoform X2 [Mixophyes fleayi]|uniref:transmembrane protein 141 isoform X2 n=1 Tax=Mixophyes fleayi TaxID=3061075 RepID=UPI003F4DF153
MNMSGRLKEALVQKHPGLPGYTSCQSQAFMKGVVTFISGTGGALLIQTVLGKRLPYPLQWKILLSVGVQQTSDTETQSIIKRNKYGDKVE